MIYIRISEKHDAKGLHLLMTNGTVKCLPDNVYIVNKEQLKLLDKNKIRKETLKEAFQQKEILITIQEVRTL